tara:strand:+ start:4528 stop:4734 length:207 start_codon:yes stop_codon:yes gene_type:complete
MTKKISLNEQIEIWAKEREANPIRCKCGSTEHESVMSRGLAGMTVITSCPLEIEAAHKAFMKSAGEEE